MKTEKLKKLQKLFVIVVVIVTIVMLADIASQHDISTTVTTENPPFAEKQKISVPGLVGIIAILSLFLFKPLLRLLSEQQQKGPIQQTRNGKLLN